MPDEAGRRGERSVSQRPIGHRPLALAPLQGHATGVSQERGTHCLDPTALREVHILLIASMGRCARAEGQRQETGGRGDKAWRGQLLLARAHARRERTRSRRPEWKWCGSSPWCCAIAAVRWGGSGLVRGEEGQVGRTVPAFAREFAARPARFRPPAAPCSPRHELVFPTAYLNVSVASSQGRDNLS